MRGMHFYSPNSAKDRPDEEITIWPLAHKEGEITGVRIADVGLLTDPPRTQPIERLNLNVPKQFRHKSGPNFSQ